MIVVDTNLLVYLYVTGERTRQAEAVFLRDPVWATPFLWRSEFRNTLVGLVRRRALALDDALRITSEAEHAMAGREYSVVSRRVLQLAADSGCSAHDCEFVSLAEDLGVTLVTADRRLLASFPSIATSPDAFTA